MQRPLVHKSPGLCGALLLTLAAGCGGGPAPSEAVDRPVRLGLAERLPFADVHGALAAIPLHGDDARPLLTSGWYDYEEPQGRAGFRWTRRRNALVEIPIVEPADLILRLELDSLHASFDEMGQAFMAANPQFQSQRVTLLWNGQAVRTLRVPLAGEPSEVAIPASLQRPGPNRLEILANYWASPRMQGYGTDPRTLGVRCRGIELQRRPAQHSAPAPAAIARGERITQHGGSVITYYLPLPRSARLRGEGVLVGAAAATGSAPRGRVALTVLDEAGQSRQLFSKDLDGLRASPQLQLDADLSEWSGRMVALSLSFSRQAAEPDETPPPQMEWRDLRIEGVEAAPPPTPALARDRYNVLLVLFDSLRADHVEPYGSTRVATPTLAALARSGVTFANARSNASWTRPSVASMLTSLLPAAHGVSAPSHRLPDSVAYLPAILRAAGYRTVGVTNVAQISPNFGFQRGFDRLRELYKLRRHYQRKYRTPEERARFVWEEYLEPAVDPADGRRFFVYLHESDPHSPYEPPPPYDALYDFGYRGRLHTEKWTLGLMRSDPLWLEPVDIAYLESQYRGEVAFMDRYLRWLLDRLEERGLRQNTLVLFVSDHGEEFWDHRSMGHGQSVYEELLRVPLILSLPGVLPENRRLAPDVTLADLTPTILDLLGLEIPAAAQGQSLLPYLNTPEAERPPRPSIAHSNRLEHDAVQYGDWKLIRENGRTSEGNVPQLTLYNLRDDPEERIDRWPEQLVVGKTLLQLLDEELARSRAAAAPSSEVSSDQLDPDVVENLRALGYAE